MSQKEWATCPCIISHPTQPKFMVIKRSDGSWAPPSLRLPTERSFTQKAGLITRGIREHFGLQVTALRVVTRAGHSHVVELEMQTDRTDKPLQAVWVGREEYARSRKEQSGKADVFTEWFRKAEDADGLSQRLPWEKQGWFQQAVGWIEEQLNKSGIRITGPVEQYRWFYNRSAILRVMTDRGYYYFKASSAAFDNEAAISAELADRWPQYVPKPVAIDAGNNWQLMPDLRSVGEKPLGVDDLLAASESLAQIQIDSLPELGRFAELGCQTWGTDRFLEFLSGFDRLYPVLQSGSKGLSDEELEQLGDILDGMKSKLTELDSYNIPNTLVHSDFQVSNLYRNADGYWIADWSSAVVAHPFFSLCARSMKNSEESDSGTSHTTISGRDAERYLARFEAYGEPAALQEALALVNGLSPVWHVMLWTGQLPFLQAGDQHSRRVEWNIRSTCRKLLAGTGLER